MAISQADAMREENPDLYHKILDCPFEKELVDLVKTDLPRTFPENIYFSKEANHQMHLFNILIAYAHNNRNVGYCQGLNYIAGISYLLQKVITNHWLLFSFILHIYAFMMLVLSERMHNHVVG